MCQGINTARGGYLRRHEYGQLRISYRDFGTNEGTENKELGLYGFVYENGSIRYFAPGPGSGRHGNDFSF